VAAAYFVFNPEASVLAPKCPVKLITGFSCPSCGIQRALHAAMHGHLLKALKYNFFLIVALPYLGAAVVASYGKGAVSAWVRTHLLSPTMLWIYIGLFFAWWIVRNLLGI